MSYPLVKVFNSTGYEVRGEVVYVSYLCSDDKYSLEPDAQWTALNRGVCLLKRITAEVITDEGVFQAIPYESSGTAYSNFAVIKTGSKSFVVTRIVN